MGAVALGNERLEIIRNLPYDQIGTVGGFVPGPIPQSENVQKNGFSYLVKTAVEYVDDDFDGTFETGDTVPNDYKKATVTIEWQSGGKSYSESFVSFFVPDGLESDVGGGILSVNVVDSATLNPIKNAEVIVDSVEDSPEVYGTLYTDNSGNARVVGIPQQLYRIFVSKEGFENFRTYPNPPSSPFTPVDPDLFVVDDNLVIKTILIGQSSDLSIKASDISDGGGIEGISFQLSGGRKIGTAPDAFDYEETVSTDSSGEIHLEDLSAGVYEVVNIDSLGNSQYSFIGSDVENPIQLGNGETKEANFLFVENDVDSLLVKVLDGATGMPIEGAAVRVYNGVDYDETGTTGSDGRIFFPLQSATPATMTAGSYDIEISADGFQSYSGEETVNDFTSAEISLNPS